MILMNAEPKPFVHDAIHDLAVQTEHSVDEVRAVYETELEAVYAEAKVKTFVPIFAKRRTLERLTGPGSRSPRR